MLCRACQCFWCGVQPCKRARERDGACVRALALGFVRARVFLLARPRSPARLIMGHRHQRFASYGRGPARRRAESLGEKGAASVPMATVCYPPVWRLAQEAAFKRAKQASPTRERTKESTRSENGHAALKRRCLSDRCCYWVVRTDCFAVLGAITIFAIVSALLLLFPPNM